MANHAFLPRRKVWAVDLLPETPPASGVVLTPGGEEVARLHSGCPLLETGECRRSVGGVSEADLRQAIVRVSGYEPVLRGAGGFLPVKGVSPPADALIKVNDGHPARVDLEAGEIEAGAEVWSALGENPRLDFWEYTLPPAPTLAEVRGIAAGVSRQAAAVSGVAAVKNVSPPPTGSPGFELVQVPGGRGRPARVRRVAAGRGIKISSPAPNSPLKFSAGELADPPPDSPAHEVKNEIGPALRQLRDSGWESAAEIKIRGPVRVRGPIRPGTRGGQRTPLKIIGATDHSGSDRSNSSDLSDSSDLDYAEPRLITDLLEVESRVVFEDIGIGPHWPKSTSSSYSDSDDSAYSCDSSASFLGELVFSGVGEFRNVRVPGNLRVENTLTAEGLVVGGDLTVVGTLTGSDLTVGGEIFVSGRLAATGVSAGGAVLASGPMAAVEVADVSATEIAAVRGGTAVAGGRLTFGGRSVLNSSEPIFRASTGGTVILETGAEVELATESPAGSSVRPHLPQSTESPAGSSARPHFPHPSALAEIGGRFISAAGHPAEWFESRADTGLPPMALARTGGSCSFG